MSTYAYFAVFGTGGGLSEGIYKVDTASFATTRLTPVFSPTQIAVTTDGTKIYSTSNSGTDVYCYDTTSGSLLATITCPTGVSALEMSFDGGTLYAGSQNGSEIPILYIIDTASNTISTTIPATEFTAIKAANHISAAPDGQHVYLVATDPVGGVFSYAVVDTATDSVTSYTLPSTSAGGFSGNMGISADSTLGYVVMPNSGNTGAVCAVIDLVGNTIVTSVALTTPTSRSSEFQAVCDHVNLSVYCTQGSTVTGDGQISIVDALTNTESYTAAGLGNPAGAALDELGDFLFIGDTGSGDAQHFDTNSHVLGSLSLTPTWGVTTQKVPKIGNPIVMVV